VSKLHVTVGGEIEKDASRRFIDAWRRAESGKRVHERHLVFENWDTLACVLSGKRMELLGYVKRNEVRSIRALAQALGRDYRNVHADVKALEAAGLVENTPKGVRADYDAIETRIAI
jgi:predicted transcriptional regulator